MSALPDAGDALARTWSGAEPIGPAAAIRVPADERSLRAVLARDATPLRPLGSRFSRGSLLALAPGGGGLDLGRLRGLVRHTPETASFGAGTTLQEVFRTLADLGRMLPCSPGVISAQTLAGALGTGTHGQGLAQSSLADVATAMRTVDADGDVWTCYARDPRFGALQLNLGCLGVITEITLRTVPLELFTCIKLAVDSATLAAEYVRWNREYRFCKAWWFPERELAHVWLVRPATRAESRLARPDASHGVALSAPDGRLNGTVAATVRRMGVDTGATDPDADQFRTVTRFRDFSDATGDIYQLLCKGIPVAQVNLEVAVPLASFADVLAALAAWHGEAGARLHYPIILRATGPSAAWLSPAYQREVCYVGFVAYLSDDGRIAEAIRARLHEVQRVLAGRQGRPHWGKSFDPDLYDFRSAYPRWDAFRALRERRDPDGRFGNPFLARVLG